MRVMLTASEKGGHAHGDRGIRAYEHGYSAAQVGPCGDRGGHIGNATGAREHETRGNSDLMVAGAGFEPATFGL